MIRVEVGAVVLRFQNPESAGSPGGDAQIEVQLHSSPTFCYFRDEARAAEFLDEMAAAADALSTLLARKRAAR